MENRKAQLCNAFKALGVKNAHIHIENRFDRGEVYVNGKYFGVFDYTRNTFVD